MSANANAVSVLVVEKYYKSTDRQDVGRCRTPRWILGSPSCASHKEQTNGSAIETQEDVT